MARVLVTPRSLTRDGHPALGRLRDAGHEVVLGPAGRQPNTDELRALLPGVVGWLAGVETIDDGVLAAAPMLRVIARNGVGIDNIDLAAAHARGVIVRTTPGANAGGVAELAFGLMFALARAIPASDRAIKAGEWERHRGIELRGRTLGVVGCGQIGQRVCALGIGIAMRVAAFDPAPPTSFAPGPGFRFAPLEQTLTESDVVSLHCPAPAGGQPIVDAAMIGRVKPGVLIVNTARHALIDAEALAAGIESGRVGGAALDVFAAEPPVVDRLIADPRVIATPHVGGYTEESVGRAVAMAVDELLTCLSDEACGANHV